MILTDYHRFRIHPDRIKKIEKFLQKNDLTCKLTILEEEQKVFLDTLNQVRKTISNDMPLRIGILDAQQQEDEPAKHKESSLEPQMEDLVWFGQNELSEEKVDFISECFIVRPKQMLNSSVHKSPAQGAALLNRFIFKIVWKTDEQQFQQPASYFPGPVVQLKCPRKLNEFFVANLKEY